MCTTNLVSTSGPKVYNLVDIYVSFLKPATYEEFFLEYLSFCQRPQ